MGKIFYVMGKSSSGKDTIYNRLVVDRELGLNRIVGYTTRPMREGEINGKEYFFTNEQELKQLEDRGKVVEKRTYKTIYGDWNYFTVDDGNLDIINKNYILIGTLESYRSVREYFGKDRIVPIYINVEDGIRLMRAVSREMQQKNPGYEELCRWFLADSKDFSDDVLKDLEINTKYENDDLERCYLQIKEVIKKSL